MWWGGFLRAESENQAPVPGPPSSLRPRWPVDENSELINRKPSVPWAQASTSQGEKPPVNNHSGIPGGAGVRHCRFSRHWVPLDPITDPWMLGPWDT